MTLDIKMIGRLGIGGNIRLTGHIGIYRKHEVVIVSKHNIPQPMPSMYVTFPRRKKY